MDSKDIFNVLSGQAARKITFVSKSFLEILEDLENEELISKEHFLRLRKRVLDTSGNSSRELQELTDRLTQIL